MKLIKKDSSRNLIFIIIGFFLIAIGLGYLTYEYVSEKEVNNKENNQIEEYLNETDEEQVNVDKTKETKSETQVQEKYSMVLKIPKIDLNKGLYDIDSSKNNVKYNIEIIKGSDMPDVVNGNLILAGHNGTSSIAFFNKLYKINNGDEVYIYYQNIEYTYKIVDIYDVPKTGEVTIYRNPNETIIALITCKKGTRDKQSVYIGNLISKTDY